MRLTLVVLFLVCCAVSQGIGPGIGIGAGTPSVAPAAAYQSITTGTQGHAAADRWGNFDTSHMLIDTVTIPVAIQVSRASWNLAGAYTLKPSRTNLYDAGLHCITGACQAGKLYTHTGLLTSAEAAPALNVQMSVPLVADQNTVCQSFPCTIPAGTYSLSTGTGEHPADAIVLWSDDNTWGEYHIVNAGGHPAQPFISGYVQTGGVSNTPSGGNTQVTLTVTMTNGQTVNSSGGGFQTGMQIRVQGLLPSACNAGPNNIRPSVGGTFTLTAASSTTITYIVPGTVTCAVEGKTDGSQTCGRLPATAGAVGFACVAAGLPPQLTVLLQDRENGYYCWADGTECARNNFAGPAGTQSGSHSVGMMFY